jgi:hypothetical protein
MFVRLLPKEKTERHCKEKMPEFFFERSHPPLREATAGRAYLLLQQRQSQSRGIRDRKIRPLHHCEKSWYSWAISPLERIKRLGDDPMNAGPRQPASPANFRVAQASDSGKEKLPVTRR